MKIKTWADSIISKVCNEHRNSDLRADNPATIKALNEARDKELDAAIMDAIHLGRYAEREKQAAPTPPARRYYIQNTKGYCGNSVIWWREGGHGYTSDLAKAWKVTKEKADEICAGRRPTEDIAWAADEIDRMAQRHMDMQELPAKEVAA